MQINKVMIQFRFLLVMFVQCSACNVKYHIIVKEDVLLFF